MIDPPYAPPPPPLVVFRHGGGNPNHDELGRFSSGPGGGNNTYRGMHKSPGPGTIPVHDMTNESGDGGVPEDWYTRPELYTAGEVSNAEMHRVKNLYNDIRGKPNAMVDVYRALPPGHNTINKGDWVTPSPQYARQHGMQAEDPKEDWPIITMRVPAKTLWQDGNSYYEMGYHGPSGKARRYDG